MKKTIIICVSLIIIASMVLGAVIIIKSNQKSQDSKDINGKGNAVMTYEEFTQYVRPDISNEVKDEIQALYDEYSIAPDDSARKEVITRFYSMENIFIGKDSSTKGDTGQGKTGTGGK